jgi:hypothetical protein
VLFGELLANAMDLVDDRIRPKLRHREAPVGCTL